MTGWAQQGVLSHQCDTLPGDSGSPLLLKTADGWQLIAIQSSAPAAKDRYRADNRALAVPGIREAGRPGRRQIILSAAHYAPLCFQPLA